MEGVTVPGDAPPQGGGPVPGGPGYVVLNGFDFKPFNQTVGYLFTAMILKNPSASAANTYLVQANLPVSANLGLVAVRVDYDYPVLIPLVKK